MKDFFEYRQELDEISKGLAKRYYAKANKSLEKLPGASDRGISDKDAKKVAKRVKGTNRALDRAYRR